MSIFAYCGLHYGREWLKWSIRSVIDYVDEFHIFYSSEPSHGHSSHLENPESRYDLFSIFLEFKQQGKNIHWHDCGPFRHEGEHRTFAVNYCYQHGADIVMVVDADEIWEPALLKHSLEVVKDVDFHVFRINMYHFWRSLKWMCVDPACPTRFIKPGVYKDGENAISEEYLPGQVYHMGYAQSSEIIEYKQSIHGHKNEWRPGWYRQRFLEWTPGMEDVHPTNVDYWTPVSVSDRLDHDDYKMLETLVGDHPYWKKEIIS